MLNQDYESVHRNNISRLNELYPNASQQAILIIYEDVRRRLEKLAGMDDARMKDEEMNDNVPPFTSLYSDKVLKATIGKPLIKQKVTESTPREQPQNPRQPRKRRNLLILLSR